MAVDPNDMLIFRMRGMQFGAAAQKGAAKQQAAKPAAATTPNTFGARTISEEEETVEARAQEEQDDSMDRLARFYEQQSRSMHGFISGQEEAAQEPSKKKSGKVRTAKEEMQAAKGLTCVNHPWRPAYAVCDYCDRAFCYADLVSRDGRLYCLEDIDNVSKSGAKKAKEPVNVFARYAGGVLVLNALLIGYFVYPQLGYVVTDLMKIGIVGFLLNIGSNIGISFINVVLMALGIIAGILLFARSKNGYLAGTFVGALTLIFISYEYLNTNVTFLLAITLLAFVSIAVLAFSRMSGTTVEREIFQETEQKIGDIDWPRIETF